MSLPTMSLCEGGTGGGGWVHPKQHGHVWGSAVGMPLLALHGVSIFGTLLWASREP